MLAVAVITGFVVMLVTYYIVGDLFSIILGGLVAGFISGSSLVVGALAGFLASIIGFIVLWVLLVLLGISLLGPLSLIVVPIASAVFAFIIIFLGLIGAIGGVLGSYIRSLLSG